MIKPIQIFCYADLEPAPAPVAGSDVGPRPVAFSPPSPVGSDPPTPAPDVDVELQARTDVEPVPAPGGGGGGEAEEPAEVLVTPPPPPVVGDTSSGTVTWCAVRNEFDDCQYYLSLLKQTDTYIWKCVQRETTQECLESIKNGDADLINLEPGLAYIAFLNYYMKAIANEVYCNHAESYSSVAVVNRKACEANPAISLKDFMGHKSCHGGYSTAMGWNYPFIHLKEFLHSDQSNDREITLGFFSSVCAPSEFEGMGVCSGCGNENGSCSSTLYYGHSGAFRCLVEELGDIAFIKEDTALLYSMEGPYNKTWSRKSIKEFMYLCPQGGCREINGYPGDCIFGSVPANVIMARNSISSQKRSAVLHTLLNETWFASLSNGKNGEDHLFSSSTQRLAAVKKLTRSYLGISASISQTIQGLNVKEVQATPSAVNPVSDVSSATLQAFQRPLLLSILSILLKIV